MSGTHSASLDSTTELLSPQAEIMKARVLELQEALQQQLPGYESLLHTIHRNLQEDPDTVHLLSPQEVGVIVAGLKKKTGIQIAKADADKAVKGAGNGKGKKIDVGDL